MSPVTQSRPGASAQGHREWRPKREHQPVGHIGRDGTSGVALHYHAVGLAVHTLNDNRAEKSECHQ
eukprot:1160695-Alexandrium_andersonii.AAC.1